jgi:predicted RecA/RadA family phage recombinase
MKNYIQSAARLQLAAPSTVASGALVTAGKELVGVALDGASSGQPLVIDTEGVYELAKLSGTAFAVGDRAYWNGSAVTIVPTALYIGTVVEVAADTAVLCKVMLAKSRNANTLLRNPINLVAKHDASAASNGTAILACFQQGGRPFLASALAGSASVWLYLASSADAVHCTYNANPASNLAGVAVYIDHDAADGFALRMVSPTGLDVHLQTATGRVLTIKHDANAASVGVQAYADHDAAAAARVLFVSPAAADLNIPTSGLVAALLAI